MLRRKHTLTPQNLTLILKYLTHYALTLQEAKQENKRDFHSKRKPYIKSSGAADYFLFSPAAAAAAVALSNTETWNC